MHKLCSSSLLLQVQALNTVDSARDGAVPSRPKMCWGVSAVSTCNISSRRDYPEVDNALAEDCTTQYVSLSFCFYWNVWNAWLLKFVYVEFCLREIDKRWILRSHLREQSRWSFVCTLEIPALQCHCSDNIPVSIQFSFWGQLLSKDKLRVLYLALHWLDSMRPVCEGHDVYWCIQIPILYRTAGVSDQAIGLNSESIEAATGRSRQMPFSLTQLASLAQPGFLVNEDLVDLCNFFWRLSGLYCSWQAEVMTSTTAIGYTPASHCITVYVDEFTWSGWKRQKKCASSLAELPCLKQTQLVHHTAPSFSNLLCGVWSDILRISIQFLPHNAWNSWFGRIRTTMPATMLLLLRFATLLLTVFW